MHINIIVIKLRLKRWRHQTHRESTLIQYYVVQELNINTEIVHVTYLKQKPDKQPLDKYYYKYYYYYYNSIICDINNILVSDR